jgi:tight adherence protein B
MPFMTVFLLMVFVTIFLLAYLLVVPTFGGDRKMRKQLSRRVQDVNSAFDQASMASLLREKYLHSLSPFERALERLPGAERLNGLIEHSGRTLRAYQLVLISAAGGLTAGLLAWLFTREIMVGLAAGALIAFVPFFKLKIDSRKRFDTFEEQLPDALDTITRALRAGHPFNDSLHLVGEEMDDPIAREFEMTFAEMNYGFDSRAALLNLLERMPSVSVMAMVTSVLIQRETGGNLAEVLQKISVLIRSRFRFQRKVKTLSAEGRMSAWVLSLVPLVLVVVIHLTSPEYLPMLIDDPTGRELITGAFVGMILGLLWIRRIIRIDV